MVFNKRTLSVPDTLGQRLRQLREEERLTIDDLARELQIAAKYLQAVEGGHYDQLPGEIYARNFVRKYVERMSLDPAAAMTKFEAEYNVITQARPSGRPLLVQRTTRTEIAWWRRHLRLIAAGVVVLGVLSYFGWQIFQLWQPPELLVITPATDISVNTATIEVSGQTDPGAKVTINRQEVTVNQSGQFKETVDVRPGLNTLRIAASTSRSSERVVIRQVLVEQER